jgi:hypothetical protein
VSGSLGIIAGGCRPSETVRELARLGPACVISHRMAAELEAELGSAKQVAKYLARLATRVGRPIGMNGPTEAGSQTIFISPRGWSDERLAGWVAAKHQELEAEFGPASIIRRAS